MEMKILGIIFISFGLGILLAKIFPWWGCILAVLLVAAGVFLIVKKC